MGEGDHSGQDMSMASSSGSNVDMEVEDLAEEVAGMAVNEGEGDEGMDSDEDEEVTNDV